MRVIGTPSALNWAIPSTAHRVGHAAAPRRSRPVSDRRAFDGDVETNQLAGAADQFEFWRRGGLLAVFDR